MSRTCLCAILAKIFHAFTLELPKCLSSNTQFAAGLFWIMFDFWVSCCWQLSKRLAAVVERFWQKGM